MNEFKVAEARARFGEILDQAEHGEPVFIERHGVRFVLRAEPRPVQPLSKRSFFSHVDEAVLSGQWTWDLGKQGLRFRARRKRA